MNNEIEETPQTVSLTTASKTLSELNRLWRAYLDCTVSRFNPQQRLICAQLAQNTSVIIDNFKRLYPQAQFSTNIVLPIRNNNLPRQAINLIIDILLNYIILLNESPANLRPLSDMMNDLLLQQKTLLPLIRTI